MYSYKQTCILQETKQSISSDKANFLFYNNLPTKKKKTPFIYAPIDLVPAVTPSKHL